MGDAATDLQCVLDLVRARRAIDFSVYRPRTIRRRIDLRLLATGIPDYASYNKYLIQNPAELDALIDSLTVKVSHFFRNPLVFEALREIVLPEILGTFSEDTLRIWSAGCAHGEEAYSIAILLKEIVKREEYPVKVFIIGTDIDSDAIEDAKKAVYKAGSVSEVKKDYLDKYFSFTDGLYYLNDEIKSMVTFSYHDVTTFTAPKDGIFSDYHLILCRNVLIYFNSEVSARIRENFHNIVSANGYLVLGEAETMGGDLTNAYEEIMHRTKIFRRMK